MTKDPNVLYCSFCGKSQHEVTKLIAGPAVFICNECIELCHDIVLSETMPTVASEHTPDEENKQLRKLLGEALKMLNTLTTTRTSELESADKVITKIKTLLKPEPSPTAPSQDLSV